MKIELMVLWLMLNWIDGIVVNIKLN
jgi:hypothetical protein